MNHILKKLKYLDFDNKFALKIINKYPNLFSLINPNLITLIGILLNKYILKYILEKNMKVSCFLITIRILIDIFDGNIARRFNKKSSVGGFLDTTSDVILSYIYSYLFFYLITKSNKLSLILSSSLIMIMILYLKNNNSIDSHENIKKFVYVKNNLHFLFEIYKIMTTTNLLLTLPIQFLFIYVFIKNS